MAVQSPVAGDDVHSAVSVAIFFGRHKRVSGVAFDARNFSVASPRDLYAHDGAARIRIRPGIFLSVARPREPDFLELLVGAVVFPAIDLAVSVLVDFDLHDARAVHVADGVDLAIAFTVVFEPLEPACSGVVLRRHAFRGIRGRPVTGSAAN